jgi:hypothetical protein
MNTPCHTPVNLKGKWRLRAVKLDAFPCFIVWKQLELLFTEFSKLVGEQAAENKLAPCCIPALKILSDNEKVKTESTYFQAYGLKFDIKALDGESEVSLLKLRMKSENRSRNNICKGRQLGLLPLRNGGKPQSWTP